MSKSTGPNKYDMNGNPYRCLECGSARLRGTQLCVSCKEKYKSQHELMYSRRESTDTTEVVESN